MVQQRNKTSRSLPMASENGSEGGSSKDCDNVYCVVLHVAEAINFVGRDASEQRDLIVMNAALNTSDFDVEGSQSVANESVVFNSNCIWECDLTGIKRIKTDHRPVKLTFSACRGTGEKKPIGSLLLPLRGLPVLSTLGSHNGPHLKMIWHKLICISSGYRSQKPEVLLVLAIVKKSILHTKDFDHLMQFPDQKAPPPPPLRSAGHSVTASMLQSQANIYVQSLMQLGLLQVGNDPLIDCDIIEVVLQLKQLRNVNRLVKWLNQGKEPGSVVVMFDFVGNVTNIELKLNESDSYAVNDVLGLRFKTSLRSMRLYFQRIFYLPFNMYVNGTAIANYRMDFNNLLPPDSHFADQLEYSSLGSFSFNRIGRQDSARDPKPPLMEYSFSVEIKNKHSRQEQVEPEPAPSIASGVIRELPTNRKDTETIALSNEKYDSLSVASLNVGAELSASEESGGVASTHDDSFDINDLTDLARKQSKRRKFSRMKGEELNMESEDEPDLVVREELKEDFGDKESNEVEMDQRFNNRKNLNCILSSSEEILDGRSSRSSKLQTDSKEPLPSKKLKIKTRLMASKKLKPSLEDTEILSDVTSLQQFELEEKILAEEDKLKSEKRTRIKTSQIPKYIKTQTKGHEVDNFSDISTLQEFERVVNRLEEEDEMDSTKVQRKKAASKEHMAVPINQEVRKSKKVSKEARIRDSNELEFNEVLKGSSSECITETTVRRKKYVKVSKTDLREEINIAQDSSGWSQSPERPVETYDVLEESMDNDQFLAEHLASYREKLCKKSKTTKIVKKRGSITETDLIDQDVPCQRTVKSKTLLPEHLEDTSISTQDSVGKAKSSSGDLALRARWVQVNNVQTTALEETELYLEETCQTELHEIQYEDQLALGLAKPLSRKNKLRTVRENEMMSVYSNQSQGDRLKNKKRVLPRNDPGSEEYISLPEYQSKSEEVICREVRVLKKKKPKQTIVEDESHPDESLEEQVIKPTRRKVKQSTVQDESHLDESLEEQPVKPTRRKVKNSIVQDESHLDESLEEQAAQPIRRKVKQSIVQDESHLDESLEEQPVKPTRRKVKHSIVQDESHLKESLEEQAVKPIKRKVLRKKSSVIVKNKELPENGEPQDEYLTVQTKRKIRSKPVADKPLEDDAKASKMLSPRDSIKSTSSRKSPKDMSNLDDFDMDHSTNRETVGQRITSWRRQQIERFEEELAHKERHYKAQLEEMEYQELQTLQQNYEDQEEEKMQADQSVDYEAKFNELEQHIAQLQKEMEGQVRLFQSRSQELHQENQQLATEKAELKARIADMEQEIIELRCKGSDEAELKEVLEELKSQNSRYFNLTRQKDRYKKQWRRCARRVQALKMAMCEKDAEIHMEANTINLREVLTKDALSFEQEYGQYRGSGTPLQFPFSTLSGSGDASNISQLSSCQDISQSFSENICHSLSQTISDPISQPISLSTTQATSQTI